MKKIALEDKSILNPKEAAAYFGVGEVRLRAFLKKNPGAPYTIYYGNRCLIVKEKFARYLEEHPDFIKRRKEKNVKKETR